MKINLTILCDYPMWAKLNPHPDHFLFFANFDAQSFINNLNDYLYRCSRFESGLSDNILAHVQDYKILKEGIPEREGSMKIALTINCDYTDPNSEKEYFNENFDGQKFVNYLNEYLVQYVRYEVGFMMFITDYNIVGQG